MIRAANPPPSPQRADAADNVLTRVAGLTVRYGSLLAVDGLDLQVRAGEMFGLIGPDGAGKTTTLRVILGLLRPQQGQVETCGLDPQRQRMALTGQVGYLSQRFSLYGDLTVDENVAFFADIHGVRQWRPRRDELLERMKLAPFRTRLAAQLSGGMKQKLALACTLVHAPRLLVLDEPTTGVDPVSRRDFWRLLVALQREGLTILMTTPYLDEAERCQRVGLMHHGTLLAVDTPENLRAQWDGAMLEVLARPKQQALAALRRVAGVLDVQTFGERFHVTLPTGASAAHATAVESQLRQAGVEVEQVRPTLPTLEDIFLARIRAAGTAGAEAAVRWVRTVALAMACIATAAHVAAAQPTHDLSLGQAVEQALKASPQVAAAAARQQAAAAGERGAKAARMPQLDVNAGYQRTSDIPELTLTVPGMPPRTLFPNIPDNTRARLGLQLPLYTGGRLSAQVRAAQEEASAAGSELDAARADLVLETTAAYWQLVAARERERVAANAVSTYEAHVADARHRLELGLTARNEVLAVEVERDRAELARLQAAHDARVAQANLQRLLGLPPEARLQPTDQLDQPVSQPAPLEQLVADALVRRPERAAAAARAQSALARARAERAARLPQVAAAAGIDWANPNREILPPDAQWDDTWDAGVNLSLNLFDGGRIGSAVAQAKARAEAARQALRAVEDALRLEVTAAAFSLDTARQTVVVAQRAQASAEENRRVAADRYGEGVIPSSELLDAETALLNAGLDLTRARAQLQVAAAALQRAVGGTS